MRGMMIENEHQKPASLAESWLSELKEIVHYDLDTGIFTWLKPECSHCKPGDICGWWDDSKEYWMIEIRGIRFPAHKLAWFYVHGEWKRVDHKDRTRGNNRITNLRPATKSQNAANQGVRISNMLGIKGVQQRGSKYRAYITHDYHTYHLGSWDSTEEAQAAY